MNARRISKIAGLSVIGFCAAAAVADKVNLNPMASQVAGFVGALAGTLVGRLRSKPAVAGKQEKMIAADHTRLD